MNQYSGNLLELPKKGNAMIVTDIHGNINDFNKIMDIWKNFQNKDNHIVITGDFIQAMELKKDNSIEILDSVKYNFENSKNFHLLLGNHEWSIISKHVLYKGGENLTLNFEKKLKDTFGNNWTGKMEEYTEFFKKLPIAVRTGNKVFISHSGPSKNIENMDDIINITNADYLNPDGVLYELLWNRFGDYRKKDLDSFLEITDCNALIVGHTPVNGYKLIEKKLLVISSSYSKGKKAYVELDLENNIKDGTDILKMIKYIN